MKRRARFIPSSISGGETIAPQPRHSGVVRVTHWITALCFFALLVSGIEIVISHPRFYWGETGNVLTQPLFQLPIPSSRKLVQTGYDYVLPDQNGWSRALHFEAAWIVMLTGILYVLVGFVTRHFRQHLVPTKADAWWQRDARDATTYNGLQRVTYLAVVFVLFPLVIWTGLAMSLAFEAACSSCVVALGGRQSARTIHFFVAAALLLFLCVHVLMVWRAGFWNRTGAMITGRLDIRKEDA